ncbi:hypothetical protein [Palleronia sp. LCG004]|uniref:hypothetical protein n=1 Tax=Palleronia sp. LCG004 TaxID=3079304 RepID=UPI0029422406|nr:hypothetical protein [Palleronia sp. LCG004]WOI58088.1 hypothetical protein RVY76_17265 [Palleronia sp. LCG004]
MRTGFKIIALVTACAGLAGCVDDMESQGEGLSGTPSQFDAMEGRCLSQAAGMTGVPQSAIGINERLQTGGGPILTLDAAGSSYTCRLEDDGSVTVFSEFAD